jgi:hypothetical protein
MSASSPTSRILFKIPLKTIADRRARRFAPTVPPFETEFSEQERDIFADLERRKANRHQR